ncbi:MAG: hypothetical protein VX587_00110 [Thermoproteota archaeon]|nr:hypothetical protein [Thermoproteota archaeon]
MHNRVKGIFLTGILTSSILVLILIPFAENEADATRDDKPPGISIFFCGHNKNKKTLAECDDTIEGYSWGSKINILIFAPAWNEDKYKIDVIGDDPEFPIGAYSRTSKHYGPCKLVETEPDSGLFYGRLKLNGFPHDAHGTGVKYLWGSKTCESGKGADNESIKIGAGGGSEGGAFTVFWKYDTDKTITKTGYYSWREGTIEFDKNYYELDGVATVTLHDIDLEVYPFDMNTIRLRVWSDTDTEGITLTSSYMYSVWRGIQASFEFTTDDKSQNDSELRISPGDRIYAQYTDRTLPRPYSNDDHKEIFATAFMRADLGKPIDFDRVDITKSIRMNNEHGKTESISTIIEAKNHYKTNLEAYVIHQIKDEDERVIHIDWSRVFAPSEGTFMINHNCDVIKSGKYTIDIFVLNNLDNPVPYASKFSETIII